MVSNQPVESVPEVTYLITFCTLSGLAFTCLTKEKRTVTTLTMKRFYKWSEFLKVALVAENKMVHSTVRHSNTRLSSTTKVRSHSNRGWQINYDLGHVLFHNCTRFGSCAVVHSLSFRMWPRFLYAFNPRFAC